MTGSQCVFPGQPTDWAIPQKAVGGGTEGPRGSPAQGQGPVGRPTHPGQLWLGTPCCAGILTKAGPSTWLQGIPLGKERGPRQDPVQTRWLPPGPPDCSSSCLSLTPASTWPLTRHLPGLAASWTPASVQAAPSSSTVFPCLPHLMTVCLSLKAQLGSPPALLASPCDSPDPLNVPGCCAICAVSPPCLRQWL